MRYFKNVMFFVLMLIGASTVAQDIHFSQFYMSPLNLNPALTGVMNCNTRFVANYRNQWAPILRDEAYNTYSVSYDQKKAVGRSDYFGIGGTLWGDRAGALSYGTTQARLSFSYSKKMGGYRKTAHYLVFGAEGGVTQRKVDITAGRWPSQHDGNGGYNAAIAAPVTVNEINPEFLHADIGAGLVWFSVLDQRNSYYVGLALHHLNQADITFYKAGDVQALTSRFTLHAGGEFELNKKTNIVPGIVYMKQGQHMEINFGTSFRFLMGTRSDPQSFQVGAWYRIGNKVEGGIHSDALIISTRFDYGNYGIGFSYDYTVSKLQEVGAANGSFEFSLNYLICGPEKRSVYCPRF